MEHGVVFFPGCNETIFQCKVTEVIASYFSPQQERFGKNAAENSVEDLSGIIPLPLSYYYPV